ncbi:serine/threonine-protein kinase CTR1-like [Bidens hawaiensis]|uniref:serine/threonine-protein kinase CTR1-like n=1 Tax=Bidens hawaiensis TaxID=980011 RepID=UPI004049B5AD
MEETQTDGPSGAQRVAQVLWSTGNLDEPIPSGFYSILPEKRLKEKFDMIPSLEELHVLESEGFKVNVIVVDMQKDKKVSMLPQLALTLANGLTSNPAAVIKKIGGLVCDFYKLPNVELSYAKGAWEEVYNVYNQGIQMLGQIKHGFCHPRAILFKVLADTVGIDCRLMVGLPKEGEVERADSHRHVSVIVELNSNELLVDIVRYPGHLVPFSTKAVYISHVYVIGQGDSAENDSCDSPTEPNSPVHGAADNSDECLLPGEVNVGCNKNATTERSTPSSSPEHYLFRGHGRSILSGQRDSPRESGGEMTISRSAGASPVGSRRRRRRSSATIIPEIVILFIGACTTSPHFSLITEYMDMGSLYYLVHMAPELIRNEPFTEKCDIFSLGVIIWELCTLHRPWEGTPSAQVVRAVGLDGTRLEIPEGPLGNLIADCWAEPEQRPNCDEILSRLMSCEMLI